MMLVVLVVILVAIVAFAGILAYFVSQLANAPTVAGCRGTIQVRSSECGSTYRGQNPTQSYWLVLSVVLNNTGTIPISPAASDWVVTDTSGGFATSPAGQFYVSPTVSPRQTVTFDLAFDMNASANPRVLNLLLPDGSQATTTFSHCSPRTIGIVPARSTDGTNWTLTFSSVPSGLSPAVVKLTIIGPSGATVLAAKALGSLTYSTDRAAYFQANPGPTLGVGDRLPISTTTYGPAGYTYQLLDGMSILAAGTLR